MLSVRGLTNLLERDPNYIKLYCTRALKIQPLYRKQMGIDCLYLVMGRCNHKPLELTNGPSDTTRTVGNGGYTGPCPAAVAIWQTNESGN